MLSLAWNLLWIAAWLIVGIFVMLALSFLGLIVYATMVWLEERKSKSKRVSSQFVPKGKVRKVAVIGAGPSGIAAAKEAMAAGMEVTVFEQTGEIGGTWVFREKEGQSSVYRSTFINTSKQFMCFSDFPMPESLPTFPHHKQIIRYFRDYAKVVDVQMRGPTEWFVRSRECPAGKPLYMQSPEERAEGKFTEETYDAVFVCSGHHTTPRLPSLPGQTTFTGRIIHSHAYKDDKNPIDCHDKRVIVVGIGNSGVDVANELSRCARQVYLSIRTGAWVMPKFISGRPMDHVLSPGRFLSWLVPMRLFARPFMQRVLVEAPIIKQQGNIKDYLGVDPPPFFSAHPTISHELLHRIGTGTIVAKQALKEFTATEAVFADGSRVKADVVIFCTGYHISFPFLPETVMKVDENNKVSLYKYVFSPDLPPTLAQIGLIQPLGAIMPISELQARWAVQVWLGNKGLPSAADMKAEIEQKREALSKRYLDRPRHTIQVDWPAYPDEIADEIGAVPSLAANLNVLVPLLFCPVLPPQYRLNGPGKWDGAAAEVQKLWKQVRNHRPTMEAGAGWDDDEH